MKKIFTVIIIFGLVFAGIYIYRNQGVSTTNTVIPTLTETYTNPDYHFSFKYPKGFTITLLGSTLAVKGIDPKNNFQIDIQKIDEDIKMLTVERIKKDLPDIVIDSPQDVLLGTGDNAGKGVAFLSEDPSFADTSLGENDRTREVWFVYNMTLYQIRTYASNDPFLQAVLATWNFTL